MSSGTRKTSPNSIATLPPELLEIARKSVALAADRVRPLTSGAVISTNQFKNGNHIEVDGTIFKIVDFQHVKPGKGGAFVRTKLRRAADGA